MFPATAGNTSTPPVARSTRTAPRVCSLSPTLCLRDFTNLPQHCPITHPHYAVDPRRSNKLAHTCLRTQAFMRSEHAY